MKLLKTLCLIAGFAAAPFWLAGWAVYYSGGPKPPAIEILRNVAVASSYVVIAVIAFLVYRVIVDVKDGKSKPAE